MSPALATTSKPPAAPRPVSGLANGVFAIVVAHGAGAGALETGLSERLSALGLGVGASVRVVKRGRSPVLAVGSARIALGPDLAAALVVLVP